MAGLVGLTFSFAALSTLWTCPSLAQTPQDFQPGSLVRLGVKYPQLSIDPAGTLAPTLDGSSLTPNSPSNYTTNTLPQEVSTVPQLMVPSSMLLGADGQRTPDQKFMVFMIDIDVIQDNVLTTVLHWFQPDLVAAPGGEIILFGNTSATTLVVAGGAPGTPAAPPATGSLVTKRQAPPLSPAAPAPPAGGGIIGGGGILGGGGIAGGVDPNAPGGIAGGIGPNAPAGGIGNPGNQNPSLTNQGSQLASAVYLPPGPPPGPPHRYVQVLFEQPPNFQFPSCFSNIVGDGTTGEGIEGRIGFDLNQFVAAAGLRSRPIAGNFFLAQNPQPGSLDANAQVMRLRDNMCGPPPAQGQQGLVMKKRGRYMERVF